jgi:hypothetical protein
MSKEKLSEMQRGAAIQEHPKKAWSSIAQLETDLGIALPNLASAASDEAGQLRKDIAVGSERLPSTCASETGVFRPVLCMLVNPLTGMIDGFYVTGSTSSSQRVSLESESGELDISRVDICLFDRGMPNPERAEIEPTESISGAGELSPDIDAGLSK